MSPTLNNHAQLRTPLIVAIALTVAIPVLIAEDEGSGAAKPWLALELGRYWEFEDEAGRMRITIAGREKAGEIEAWRVEWSSGESRDAYQAELWAEAEDEAGILVVGRLIAGRTFLFEKPYLMLKQPLDPGQMWQADLRVPGADFEDTLRFSVAEEDEVISTARGELKARKVMLEGRAISYHRWYVRGIGLVQEAGYRGTKLMNRKTLVETGIDETIADGAEASSESGDAE